MSRTLTRRAFVGAVASLSLGWSPGQSATRRSRLKGLLAEVRARHRLPGIAAAQILGGKITAVEVDGVRHWGASEPIQLNDSFHIASCTKSMTATLAALAVHRGKLDWTTTFAEAIPELGGIVRAEYRRASLQQLLAHGAKMPAYTQPDPRSVAWMHSLPGSPTAQRMAFLREVLVNEAPNEASGDGAYSNAGYVAASAMIERATQVAWEDSIRRDLAVPLRLRTLGLGYPASPSSPHRPRGHALVDGNVRVLPFDRTRELAVCLRPAGAVHVGIGDLARYALDHLNGLKGRQALLPADSYRRLHAPLRGSTSVFTLGWGARQDERIGRLHFGAGSGGWFFARIWIAPDRDAAAVVVSNSGDAAAATLEIAQQILMP